MLRCLILLTYLLIFSESVTAQSRQNHRKLFQFIETISINNQPFTAQKQLFSQVEKLREQPTILSQLQAIKNLEQRLLKFKSSGDKSQSALTLLKLGSIYKNLGATTLALESYKEALSLYQEIENRLQSALTLGEIGDVYVADLEQVEQEQRWALINRLFINSRWQKLFFNKQRSHGEKALEFYQQSLEIYQKINNSTNTNVDKFAARQGEANIFNKMAQRHNNGSEKYEKEKLLKQSLAIYQEIGDKQGEAFVLGSLSQINLINNDQVAWLELFNQARRIYQEIADSSPEDNFTARQAEANLLSITAYYWWSDNQQKALEFYERALNIYREIGDKQGEAVTLKSIGDNYGRIENREKQLEFYNQALSIYQEIGDTIEEARILDKLGGIYSDSGEVEKALEFYEQELNKIHESSQIYAQLGDSETALTFDYRQPVILFKMGKLYSKLSDDNNELEAYNQARKIYQKWLDNEGETSFLIQVAEGYEKQENLERMEEFFNHALTVAQESGDSPEERLRQRLKEANLLRNRIAVFYFNVLSDSEKGFETLNKALKIYRETGNRSEVAQTLKSIAEFYLRLGNKEKALEYYHQAMVIEREIEDFSREVYTLRRMGKIYYELGNKKKALEIFNQAGMVFQKNGEYEKAVNIIIDIAKTYTRLGEKETGLKFYRQAIPIYQQLRDYEKEAWILRIMGQLYYELENINQALKTFNQAPKAYQKNSNSPEDKLRQRSGEAWTLYEIGRTYTKLGDLKKALNFYQQALPIYEQENGAPWGEERTLDMLIRMSRIYTYFGESELALKFCQKSLNHAQEMLVSEAYISAEVFREIGKLCYQIGETETALKAFEQYGKLYQPNRINQKVRNLRFINENFFLVESESALEFCQKSSSFSLLNLNVHPAPWDQRYESDLLKTSHQEIAQLCHQIANSENPLKSFDQFRRFYQQSGIPKEVRGLMRVAEDYTELGDSKQALNFVNQAKSVNQKRNSPSGEINTLIWISRIYFQAGNYHWSLDSLSQGLRISQNIDNLSKVASMLTEMGDIYSELGDEEKALEFYQKAFGIYQDFDNSRKQTEILNRIAVSYEKLKDWKKALEFYYKALKISQENNSLYLIFIFRSIAKVYLKLEELEKALDFFKQALKFSDAPSYLYTNIGKIYSDLGEVETALQSFNKSLELLENTYPEGQAENLFGIAIIERKKGNLNRALTHIETAIYLIEQTRSRKISSEERLEFFTSKQDYYEFYIDLLMELHQQNPAKGYDGEALNISERSRARSLLELLAEANTNIRKGVDPELVIQERSLQQQLDGIERRRVEIYQREDDSLEEKTAIEQERQYLLQKYEEVQTKIRQKSPSYAALTQPQPLTLEQIQQQILDKDTLLLQYSLGEKRSFLWAITKDNISSYQLPAKALIEKAVREFRGTVTNRRANSTALVEASKSLYQMILAPVASQLKNQRLAIVSDGILHYIPFAAISLPSTSSEEHYLPLVTKHEIVNLPSASTLSILRRDTEQRKPAPKTIAIVADPVFSSDDTRLETAVSTPSENWGKYNLSRSARQLDVGIWDRLPGTRTEAEAILALLPKSESQNYFDFAANRTTATNPELSQYKIIHFATHGLLNSINPELSGIVLSMVDKQGNSLNGFLRLHDIFNLDFSADLVVLSACQTGLGKHIRGEGLVGLTRGFMYAGTPRLLVSLWNVDDIATAELMSRFYQLMLKEKLSPTEALRRAQLEMVSETEWQSPYYWSAFTLQGEWR